MFKLAPSIDLPRTAVTQSFGILGKRGSGKTFTAGRLVEQLLEHGAQTVVFDTVGIWYGLRLKEDGKTPAFDIPVLGGLHGDMDLKPNMGAAVATAIVSSKSSAVIDMSAMTKGEWRRFMVEFVENFFQLMKKERTPVQLVFEEAQEFVPQNCPPDSAHLLGAMERMCKLGRNYGIGYTLISQRPQAVNKDVLNQTECLIFMQMTGPHERKAVKGWITDVAGDDPDDVVELLPSLGQGEGVVWSPSWLRKREQVKFLKKQTYDASATPEFGKKIKAAKQLKSLDMTALKKELTKYVEEATANDPKTLKAKIAELQKEITKLTKQKVTAPAQVETRVERVDLDPVYKKLEELSAELQPLFEMKKQISAVQGLIKQVHDTMRVAEARRTTAPDTRVKQQHKYTQLLPAETKQQRAEPVEHVEGEVPLKAGARRMLIALTSTADGKMTKTQMATLAGISPKSGTFTNYLASIRKGKYATFDGNNLTITPAGRAMVAGESLEVPQTTEAVLELWKPKLKAGARRMLEVLVDAHPNSMTKNELAEASGISANSGTYTNYLASLNKNKLIVKEDGSIKASAALFPEQSGVLQSI